MTESKGLVPSETPIQILTLPLRTLWLWGGNITSWSLFPFM